MKAYFLDANIVKILATEKKSGKNLHFFEKLFGNVKNPPYLCINKQRNHLTLYTL